MIDRSMLAEIKQELKTELCAEIRNEELAAVWTQIAELREKCGLSASSNRFYYDYSDLSLYYSGTLPSQPQPSDQRGDGAAHLLLPSQPQPSDQRGDGSAHLLPPPRPPRFRRDAPQDPVDRGEGNNPDEQRKKLADREEGDVEEEEVELEASMWHMPLVVFGSGVPGAGASILSVLLLVTNIVIQCIFCYIVISSLSLPNILPETVEQLKNWRRSTAHSFKNYNELLQQSMAARVCAGDAALDSSTSQASLYAVLQAYIGEGDATFGVGIGGGNFAPGPLMTTLALFMWSLTVLKEMNATWTVTAAILRKRAPRTVLTNDEAGRPIVEGLGHVRCVCCCVLSLCRLGISLVLGFYGSLFLIRYSISLGDLLLNAVALEFVMTVDDVIFEVLAPASVRGLFPHHFGLSIKRSPDVQGIDRRTLLTLTVAMVWLVTMVLVYLSPLMQTMVEARDALCAGDTDFVYTIDGLGVMAWAYPSNVDVASNGSATGFARPSSTAPLRNFPDGSDPLLANQTFNLSLVEGRSEPEQIVDAVLRQLGRPYHQERCPVSYEEAGPTGCLILQGVGYVDNPDGPACCALAQYRMGQVDVGVFSVKAKDADSIESAVEMWNPMCQDSINWPFNYRRMLQGAMADAAELELDLRTRAAHPCAGDPYFVPAGRGGGGGACGRARPLCALETPQAATGECIMPESCQQCLKSGTYLDALDRLRCQDNNTALRLLLDNMEDVRQTFPRDWGLGVGSVVKSLRAYGCDYLAWGSDRLPTNFSVEFPPYVGGMNLCTSGGAWFPLKPLSYVCPVACGCRSGDKHCPGSCPPRSKATPRCPDHQRINGAPMPGSCPVLPPRSPFSTLANHS